MEEQKMTIQLQAAASKYIKQQAASKGELQDSKKVKSKEKKESKASKKLTGSLKNKQWASKTEEGVKSYHVCFLYVCLFISLSLSFITPLSA